MDENILLVGSLHMYFIHSCGMHYQLDMFPKNVGLILDKSHKIFEVIFGQGNG